MSVPARLDRVDRRLVVGASQHFTTSTVDVDSAADVLALIATAARAAQSDATATPLERARTLGTLAGVALKALAVRDLEARVEALERILTHRGARKEGQ